MINLNRNSIVYIICPANLATGGPELLHQLAFNLLKIGIQAKMLYTDYLQGRHNTPIHENYKKYNIPYTFKAEESENNFLLVPETYHRELYKYSKINKVIWWLSIDNFLLQFDIIRRVNRSQSKLGPFFRNILAFAKLFNITRRVNQFILNKYSNKMLNYIKSNQIIHLAQSYYAIDYLKQCGISNILYLSDYLREDFLIEARSVDLNKKQNIILYNPVKGAQFTQKIINSAKEKFQFIAIKNLTPIEVVDLLKKAKVYIDFGEHPGKDRIPREAAIMGCCVITSLKGSAKYQEDVPLPANYKFEGKEENITKILQTIEYCFNNYQKVYDELKPYRNLILEEPERFVADVKQIFTVINHPE